MFFELSKLLNILISPISWIVILLILSLVLKAKRWRRICLGTCIFIFIFFTNTMLINYIRYLSVKEYSVATIDSTQTYRVAIVMGGFASMNPETGQMRYEQDRADRLWEAVRLYKTGKVEKILITGDPTSMLREDGSNTSGLFLEYMKQIGIPPEAFILEQQARNSRENAVYTAQILQERGIGEKECLLITSATHIKRSLNCFAKAGIHPDYYPVNVYSRPARINHRAFYPQWEAAIMWQELLNEWIGDIAYRIMRYN